MATVELTEIGGETSSRYAVARTHSLETMGTVDGPGIRLVVFLQGCPMRCAYCHNPDTWEVNAGERLTVEQVAERFEANRAFYKNGGITVTGGEPLLQPEFTGQLFAVMHGKDPVAGGAAASDAGAAAADAAAATDAAAPAAPAFAPGEGRAAAACAPAASGLAGTDGCAPAPRASASAPVRPLVSAPVHTCLDTCGYAYDPAHPERFELLLSEADLVLLDIKHADPEGHRRLTGRSPERILAFGNELARRGTPVVIRHVVVPGITDTVEECERLGELIAPWRNVVGLEMLPYHTMGVVKYEKLGIPYPLEGVPQMDKARMPELRAAVLRAMKRARTRS